MPAVAIDAGGAADVLARTLIINEIFYSIQGETSKAGLPTSFIRLTGCPLRCQYCDTAYAFHEGKKMSLADIMQTLSEHHSQHVTVTGGEPLAQNRCHDLLSLLCDDGYCVSLETSGAINIANVDQRVIKVLDIKTPGSGEAHRNRFDNLHHLNDHDQIKFVICDKGDYEWSKQIVKEHRLTEKTEVLFSPSYTQLPAAELARWVLADQLPVRMQIQLHKYLWGDRRGV